jgi:hypothetical protein
MVLHRSVRRHSLQWMERHPRQLSRSGYFPPAFGKRHRVTVGSLDVRSMWLPLVRLLRVRLQGAKQLPRRIAKRIKFSSVTEKPNVVLRGDLKRPSFVRTKPNKIETTISTLSTTCDGPDMGSSLMDQINGQLAIPGIVEETEKNCSTSDTSSATSSREIHHKTTTVTTTPPKAAGVQDTHGSTCSSHILFDESHHHQPQRFSVYHRAH